MAGPRHALTLMLKGQRMGERQGSACQYDCTFLVASISSCLQRFYAVGWVAGGHPACKNE